MSDSANPINDPLGPNDPLFLPIRQAYESVPSIGGPNTHAAVTALWSRLGWAPAPAFSPETSAGTAANSVPDAPLDDLLRQEIEDALWLAPSTPNVKLTEWVARRLCGSERLPKEYRQAFLNRAAMMVRKMRAVSAVVPPALTLLGFPEGHDDLRRLSRGEVTAALSLLRDPTVLDIRHVADWVQDRLRGPTPFPPEAERQILTAIAEAIRDSRAPSRPATVISTRSIPRSEGESTVVTQSSTRPAQPDEWPLDGAVASTGELAEAVAGASRNLTLVLCERGEILLLRLYAGRKVPELATLFARPEDVIAAELALAERMVRASVRHAVGGNHPGKAVTAEAVVKTESTA